MFASSRYSFVPQSGALEVMTGEERLSQSSNSTPKRQLSVCDLAKVMRTMGQAVEQLGSWA